MVDQVEQGIKRFKKARDNFLLTEHGWFEHWLMIYKNQTVRKGEEGNLWNEALCINN